MNARTTRLGLPLLAAGQAQKELTHNESLVLLDACVQGRVVAVGLDMPPEDPQLGQCWIVGAAPQQEWAGKPGQVAIWTESGWRFVAPIEGMRFWIGPVEGNILFTQGEWRAGENHGRVFVEGVQIIGARATAIAEPAGGTVVDAEARQTLSTVLAVMREHGLIETG